MKVKVAASLSSLSLGHFMKLQEVIRKDEPEYLKIIEVVASCTDKTYGEIKTVNYKDVIKLYTKIVNMLSEYKKKKPPKEITLLGKVYTFQGDSENWNAAQWIDAKVMQEKWLTHQHYTAAIMYVEKGMSYGEEDTKGRNLNPMIKRAELFKLHFTAQIYLDIEAFFLPRYSRQMRDFSADKKLNVRKLVENTRRILKKNLN